MRGFEYNGYSTNTILEDRLVLASFSDTSESIGHERSSIAGETTITRQIQNEYGTTYSNPTYEYTLIKENGDPFEEWEQVRVERWLSSPKYSGRLRLLDCHEGIINTIYFGKFIKTSWLSTAGGYAGVTVTFEAATPYPFREEVVKFEHSSGEAGIVKVPCNSDELEEYIYPTLTIYAPNGTSTVTVKNDTDDGHSFTLKAPDKTLITIDCEHCILSGDNGTDIDFSDVGWDNIGNIYWLRLIPGVFNELEITGDAEFTLTFREVDKRAGDWL